MSPAKATTITVNTINDSSSAAVCSLRSAILTANGTTTGGCAPGAVGQDNIIFQISPLDSSVKTLLLNSALPPITSAISINGIVGNANASANTAASGTNAQLKVRLDGTGISGPGLQIDVGGTNTSVTGLVIVNFGGAGILINAANSVNIHGNFIGIEADGTTAAGNGTSNNQGGIFAFENTGQSLSGLTIGSATPANRNLISSNLGPGISLIATDATANFGAIVAGNLIGTTRDGLSGRGNNGRGIAIYNANNVRIGDPTGATARGACTGGCNVIAANFAQVELGQGNVEGANLRANHIGVNALGTGGVTTATPTLSALIIIQVSGSINVGGVGTTDGNVISGATNHGIDIQNAGQNASISIRKNMIGTNSAGTQAVPNGIAGIAIQNTDDAITIGGTDTSPNVISGNGQDGILLEGSSNVIINFNRIGTQFDGVSPLGNGARGIFLFPGSVSSSNNNRIGAAAGSAIGGNIIAFNGANSPNAAGIAINAGTGNRISRNSIFSSRNSLGVGLGIDLQGGGSTPNDSCDADTGANNLQNFPVNLSAPTSNSVSGQLRSIPANYEVEVYATPNGAGLPPLADGKTFLASTTVTVLNNVSCPGAFTNVATSVPVPANSVLSAVAIDANGNTSEFTLNLDPLFSNGFE